MKDISLWKATGTNLVLSMVVYSVLLLLLWIVERLVPTLSLLHFDDVAWCVGIPASVVGVCYILSIRNPQNYTGFYPSILMSALLCAQFFLQKNYDLALLNLVVCIPLQVRSLYEWTKKGSSQDEPFAPSFLSKKGILATLLTFFAIVAADYVVMALLGEVENGVLIGLLSAMMFASLIIANYWLVYRKNDSWLYWLVYSVSGMAFFALIGNVFSVVLFTFFLVINTMAGVGWIRATPKSNYGWLKGQ